jgi:hypothetical protein
MINDFKTLISFWLLQSAGIVLQDINTLLSCFAVLGNVLYIGYKIYKQHKNKNHDN